MSAVLSNEVTVLIAGTGSIGRRHVNSLRQLAPKARFVFLRRQASPDAYSETLGARVVANLDDALEMSPHCAVVAGPSVHHAELIVQLLAAGIPIYIEKPMVTDRLQLEAVTRAADASPRIVTMCGCNLRFLPSLLEVRELLRSGAIGRVVRASLQTGQWLPDWRPNTDYRHSYSASRELGGGVVLDLIHELDAARWLFGEYDSLAAVGGKLSSLQIESEDVAVIALKRIGGPVVAIGLDYVARRPIRRYEFFGETGSLTWDLPGRRVEIAGETESRTLAFDPSAFDVPSTYLRAMREFLEAVSSGVATTQDLREGLRSAALAIRINEEIRA
jgi:predicted dehydrogenase